MSSTSKLGFDNIKFYIVTNDGLFMYSSYYVTVQITNIPQRNKIIKSTSCLRLS